MRGVRPSPNTRQSVRDGDASCPNLDDVASVAASRAAREEVICSSFLNRDERMG